MIFLDTQKLFWETIAYRSKLVDLLGLTDIRIIKPDAESVAGIDRRWQAQQDAIPICAATSARANRLQRALSGFDAWISGRKRFHGGRRQDIPTLEVSDGRLKVEPLARFTAEDLEAYIDHYSICRGIRSSPRAIVRSAACPARSRAERATIRAPAAGPARPRPNAAFTGRANGRPIRQAKSAIARMLHRLSLLGIPMCLRGGA